jgi:Ca2+-transporting ATPase
MILLLLGAAAVSFLLADPLEASVLLGSVLIVALISLYQQRKTESALAALRQLSSPRAMVVRDGVPSRVAGREVVQGDVVLLAEGDRVPADGILVGASHLTVDEAALTGESVPVTKQPASGAAAGVDGPDMGDPGGDGTPWVFAGTLVVGGRAEMLVALTGAHTAFGRIGRALREQAPPRTRLQREFDRLVLIFALVAFVAAVTVVVVYGLTRGNWLEGALAGITAALAVIPEEIPVVFSVFLALGAWRLSRYRVLAHRPPVIESLGSVTVLCVDKTGTLTRGDMSVREVIVDHSRHMLADLPDHQLRDLVRTAALACPEQPVDPMDRAFVRLADARLPDWRRESGDLVRDYPLTPEQLSVCHVWRLADGTLYAAVKGAPEAVMALADVAPAERARLDALIDAASDDGLRILAVGGALLEADALPESQSGLRLHLLGFAGLQDPVGPGVPEAVAECARAGVRTVMITGDYPGTALAIARDAGIPTAGGHLTGADMDAMSDRDLAEAARSVSVFARMVPERKVALVRALQADGEVVGMTGDGVNDAPALGASDVGIAMGGRGTDVAREAADLVIVDDDYTSIVEGIRQGRGIFANLRKALTYIISVHVPIYGIALIPVFVAGWPLVLLPIEVVLLQLIIDPACTIAFESEPVSPAAMEEPPRPPGALMFGWREITVALAQGLVLLAMVLAVYLGSMSSGMSEPSVRSMTFVTLVVGNIALILVNRSRHVSAARALLTRRNPALLAIIGLASALLVLLIGVPPVRDALDLGPLTPAQWALAIVAGLASIVWFEIYRWLREPRRSRARHLR